MNDISSFVKQSKHPAILIVIDGFALNPRTEGNAVKQAKMPVFQQLLKRHPASTLQTSGLAVGLPEGQFGNSEVGHMNLGAGRIVYQDLTRIDKSIEDKSFFNNKIFKKACSISKEKNCRLHLLGLVSDGGVHSHINHINALIQLAKKEGVKELYIHAFLDGRDTAPKVAEKYLKDVEQTMQKESVGKIATISGRFYSMDRDKRLERTETACNALVLGKGLRASSSVEGLKSAYGRNETDEFVQPTIIDKNGVIKDGDVAIFFNFRADRMRQILSEINKKNIGHIATMTSYHKDFDYPVAFPQELHKKILGEIISDYGYKQLRIAETEKYAHVTFFFNGGLDTPFKGEDRELIPSPRDVKTYDLKPEMSAREVTDKLITKMESREYQFILINFANPDMVGHCGKMEPTIKALETVDECLGRILKVIEKDHWIALITSDHGNSDQLIYYDTGKPHTAHTAHPVPFIVIDPDSRVKKVRDGKLCDVAPTLLELLDMDKPDAMTGGSLLA